MHYQDGSEVKLGDLCAHSSNGYSPEARLGSLGIVVSGSPQLESCNLSIMVLAQRNHSELGDSGWRQSAQPFVTCVNAKDCMPVGIKS